MHDAVDEIFAADATDLQALVGACDGMNAVVSTIGLVGRGSKQTCWDVDYAANRHLLDEAVHAAVNKFVYISVVRAQPLERLQLVRAKRAFERDLRHSGVAYSILQPNGFFSDFDEYLQMARKGRVYVFGDGQRRINPIDGADVGAVVVEALSSDIAVIPLGGPEILTHEQIARAAFHALGTTPRVSRIPVGLVKAGLVLLRHLTPLRVHGTLEFPLTVLSHDVISPSTTGRRHLSQHFQDAVTHNASDSRDPTEDRREK
jgi:uncharacterized protein YbjT (DUF2867 family)